MTKQQAIGAVESNVLSSIYTRQDVLQLLNQLDDSGGVVKLTDNDICNIRNQILDDVEESLTAIEPRECYDEDDFCFEIQGNNRVVLDSTIDIDFNYISDMVRRKSTDTIFDIIKKQIKC